ncbi:MAG: hypothetical protein SFT92_01460 [Rickettsiales bacterium]|nr:hypothetical protein [Rickettsiales bacterium]
MSEQAALVALAEKLIALANKLNLADVLDEGITCVSIDELRKIVRWMRNLQATDKDLEEWLERGEIEEQAAKIDNIHRMLATFAVHLREAIKKYPSIIRDPAVVDATSAASAMALVSLEHALISLPQGHPDIPKLEALLRGIPRSYELRIQQSVRRLVDTLSAGIERVSGLTADDRTPADRMMEVSGRIRNSAHQLRSIDSLPPPAREESIELAREIIRRLKNMNFSDKTVKEMIDMDRPDERAQLAAKIDEMVESYRDLVVEAVAGNVDIMNDPRIQKANKAVGEFAHALSLMAKKEIPVSMAAVQQISADIANMPEDWKTMEGRTVGRLLQTMDAGVERAASEIQQQQEKAEQQSQASAEALSNDRNKRRSRRRRSSGVGGAAQRKVNQDLTADDRALGQGRFADSPQAAAPPPPRLNSESLDAIRALGNALRNLSNQAAELGIQVGGAQPEVKAPKTSSRDDPFGKTDRTFTQQVAEQQRSNRSSNLANNRK